MRVVVEPLSRLFFLRRIPNFVLIARDWSILKQGQHVHNKDLKDAVGVMKKQVKEDCEKQQHVHSNRKRQGGKR